jgi:hypothetical protein
MVLRYLGVSATYRRLLGLLRIESHGALLSSLKALEALGVSVTFRTGTLTELHQHLLNDQPPITLVLTGELPYWNESTLHAVVVIGLDDRHIYVNDPALPEAPIPVSHGDFELAWLERDELYAVLKRRK